MRVAVTGASGFIGHYVLQELATRSDCEEVVAAGRTAPRTLPRNSRHVPLDLASADSDVFNALGRPHVLIHLAWSGLPNYLSRHHFEQELPIQYRFLRMMVEGGLTTLLATGTCFEYGMCAGELTEDMPARPANPYAFAKDALRQQLLYLQASCHFDLTWTRLFYMWGEMQSSTSIFTLLKKAAEQGQARFGMSRGEQLRDYLPVEEVARIIVDLARLRRDNGIVNVSSGEPISIRRLVEQWIVELGLAIEPQLGAFPYPSYEPLAFWGSTRKRAALLGAG